MIKKFFLGLLVLLVAIQFFHPEKNISAAPSDNAIAKVYNVPAPVSATLKVACNDCHTNNTRYPWYNNLQPIAWFLANHVREGKEHLNLDEFGSYAPKKQAHKMEEFVKSQKEGWMPITSYTIIHRDAVLTDQQRQELINWAESVRKEALQKMK